MLLKTNLDLYRKFADKKFGFLSSMYTTHTDKYIYRSVIQANLFSYATGKSKIIYCTGLGLTPETSEVRCFFEGIERYVFLSMGSLDRTNHFFKNLNKSDAVISGEQFNYFTESQIQNSNFLSQLNNNKMKNFWYKGSTFDDDIENQQSVFIPAGAFSFDHEVALFSNTTNGWGAGTDLRSAFSAALYEIIERDAIMFSWWSGRDLLEIGIDELMQNSQEIVEYVSRLEFNPNNLKIRLHETVLGDYAISASFQIGKEDSEDKIAYCLAGAYDPNIFIAAAKAIKELCGVYFKLKKNNDFIDINKINFDEKILDFSDHINLYTRSEAQIFLNKFSHNVETEKIKNIPKPIAKSAEQINSIALKNGIRIVFCNMTMADIQPLNVYVVQIVSPDLLPLNSSHLVRPIGHKRLMNCQYIHPYPHPFP